MSINITPLNETLYQYLKAVSVRESDELQALGEATKKVHGAQMQSSPDGAQFIALLAQIINAKKILEIGTFTGYTTLAMAQATADDAKIITSDIGDKCVNVGKEYWQKAEVAHKIESVIKPALELCDELLQTQAGQFDLIFIDADKKNYPIYFEKSYELVRQGGLILIDNVLWHGKVADLEDQSDQTQSIREVNQKVFGDERVSISMVPIGDGITVCSKL